MYIYILGFSFCQSIIIVEAFVSTFDKIELILSYNSQKDIIFTVEVDTTGNLKKSMMKTHQEKPRIKEN